MEKHCVVLCILSLFIFGVNTQKSVEQVALSSCSTTIVQGLSEQLIDEMQCMQPGLMKSIAGRSDITLGSSVFPWLQTPAADALISAVSKSGKTLSVNSALRTLAQQYLLYRWKNLGLCKITAAAAPGRSNHNGGLAVDVNSYSSWISTFKAANWIWFGSGDTVHFDYKGSGTKDIRSISVQAFQRLWNRNNPNDKIAEDGAYGPNTEARLQRSPSTGFPLGATCGSTTKRDFMMAGSTNPSCTANGVAGVCMDTAVCTGTSTAGLCPGASNIQCCTNSVQPDPNSCTTTSGSGTCMYTTDCAAAGGRSVSGACPGPNNYQCCVTGGSTSGGTSGGTTTGADGLQHVNTAGVNLIKSYEGYEANFYIDAVGIKTIGYGHACHVFDCSNLQAKDASGNWRKVTAPLSKTDASDLLRGDLDKGGYEACVRNAVTTAINDNQFSALVSFVFNVGCGGFKTSTLLKRVNAGTALEGTNGVRAAFLMWTKAGGKVLSGLVKRRNSEADLYGSSAKRDTTVQQSRLIGSNTTIPCPDDATWDTSISFCASATDVYGPFPQAMIDNCIANGGQTVCTEKVTVDVYNRTMNLLKWPRDLAVKSRGSDACPAGTGQIDNSLGQCAEITGDPTVGYSRMAVYGAFPEDLAYICEALGGGDACFTCRWSMKYYFLIVSPAGMQNLDDEYGADNSTDHDSGNDYTEDQQQYTTLVNTPGCEGTCFVIPLAAVAAIGAGIIAAIVIASVVFLVSSVIAGKKGYEAWARHQKNMDAPTNNALYVAPDNKGKNPFYSTSSIEMK